MDSQKLKGHLLKDQITELESKKADLEIQLNEANLSFPEARDRLLARIKDDNNFITTQDKRT
jgi:intraflagellar transport protein 74